MPRFQFGTPGGYDVEVNALDEAAALQLARTNWEGMPRIVGRGEGDVRVFERPNGQQYLVAPGYSTTDKDAIASVLGGGTAGDAAIKSSDEFVLGDNLTAARAGELIRGIPAVGSRVDEGIGALQGSQAALNVRGLSEAMKRQRPMETMGLNMAGGVLSTAALPLAAPAAMARTGAALVGSGSRGSQVLRGVLGGGGIGAVEGATYGSGEGTDPVSRAQAMAQGGMVGGGMGAALGGATPVLKEGINNLISYFRSGDVQTIAKTLGISPDAATVIRNTFDAGGDIPAALAGLDRAGSQAMIADAGEAAQALLDASAASGGRAGQIARTAVDQRMFDSGAQVDRTLQATLGNAAEGPRRALEGIYAATRDARRTAYDAAFGSPIDYASAQGRKIEDALQRVPPRKLKTAIDDANDQMRSRGEVNRQIMASVDADGNVRFTEMPNVEQLHTLKVSLSRLGEDTRGEFGRPTTDSQMYERLATEVRRALGDAVPAYRTASAIGGDTIREKNAYLLGESLLDRKTRVEDIALDLGQNPSRIEIDAAKMGLRTRIDQLLGDVRRIPSDPNIDARQTLALLREVGSDNARAKIQSLLGAEAVPLLRAIAEADQSSAVRAAMSRNSQTAIRQAIQQDVVDTTAPGIVGKAMMGEPVGSTKALVQAVTGQTEGLEVMRRQAVFNDISKALTEKRGPEARRALLAIQAAMQGQPITSAQTEQIARALADSTFALGTPALTRARVNEDNQLNGPGNQ
jgi:hypothetical protein